jgi:hypothetical protein
MPVMVDSSLVVSYDGTNKDIVFSAHHYCLTSLLGEDRVGAALATALICNDQLTDDSSIPGYQHVVMKVGQVIIRCTALWSPRSVL